ncbi:MAG: HAMP domain-containing histidine kinase, partial [Elusimicrobia bacterium]|nr:HAMP domain-containing histidine kinase [Elusimicrobiota bacterium]
VTAERRLDRMKDEFFHSIVHDLRGPLGTIDGFVQIMGMGADLGADKVQKFMAHIRSSCERLRQLVTDILDTAKIESGTLKLNLEPVPASEILERMQALYQIQGESRGIEVRFERSPAVGALVCDRSYIERVVMNLFGNSLKFTPKGGRVSLGIREAGPSEVEFCVSDTGPGIPEDKLGVIFEKFKQLDGPAARAGYGLGLSICKKIVELHGGRIWAESKLGQGSRFLFRLPVAPVSSSVGR